MMCILSYPMNKSICIMYCSYILNIIIVVDDSLLPQSVGGGLLQSFVFSQDNDNYR